MFTAFRTWQSINDKIRCPVTVAAEKGRAIEHLRFRVGLYRERMRRGRHFVHEHPAYASARQDEEMRKLMAEPGVEKATADQCSMGALLQMDPQLREPPPS